MAFRMPSNGHYNIRLTIHAFSEFICDWMELVNESSNLHSKHPESSFMRFRAQDQLIHVNKSDQEHLQCFSTCWQEFLQGPSGTPSNGENEELDDKSYDV